MEKKIPILISLMSGTDMAAPDSSIVNVSLPIMQKQFSACINAIEWVITGYMVFYDTAQDCVCILRLYKKKKRIQSIIVTYKKGKLLRLPQRLRDRLICLISSPG